MANLKPGASGPDVKKLQETINELYQATVVSVSGDYDDATRDKVAELQKKLNVGRSSGEADPVTLKAFAVALEPKYLVELPKVQAYLTAQELAALKQVTRAASAKAVKGILNLAKDYATIWKTHSTARQSNKFWKEVVDIVTEAEFPSEQTVRKVEAAAATIESKALAGALEEGEFDRQAQIIREAYAALDKYRDETFDGAEKLVVYMEKTASVCGEALDVLMSIYTAQMGPTGQALGAGVSGGYKAALAEVIAASKTSNYSVPGGVGRVLASGVISAGIKYLLKGMDGEKFIKGVEQAAIKAGGTNLLTKFLPKALSGGGQQMMEDGLKGLPGLFDPSKKFSMDDLVNAAATSFVKGAFIKPIGDIAKNYGESAGKYMKPEFFKLPKGTELTKEGEQLLKKTVEKVSGAVVGEVLKTWIPGTKPADFEEKVREGFRNDPEVKAALKKASSK